MGISDATPRVKTVTYQDGRVRHFPIVGETYWALCSYNGGDYATVTGSHWGTRVDETDPLYTAGHLFSTEANVDRHRSGLPADAWGKGLAPMRVKWLGGSTFEKA